MTGRAKEKPPRRARDEKHRETTKGGDLLTDIKDLGAVFGHVATKGRNETPPGRAPGAMEP